MDPWISSCHVLSVAVGPKRSEPFAPIYIALLFSEFRRSASSLN
jgi:hypothetical protein